MPVGRDAVEEVEVLEGDEGEPDRSRTRDLGTDFLQTAISEVKRAGVVSVAPDAPVEKAVELMRRKKVAAVLVKRGKKLAGIFTERDLVNRALPSRGWAKAPVKKFMTPSPETLRPKDSVAYALNKMSVGRFRHVPLVDEAGAPVGIVSIRDLADFIVELIPETILNLPSQPELALHPTVDGD
jgi:CBS domain-containing protein